MAIATNVFDKQSSHFLLNEDGGFFRFPSEPINGEESCERIAQRMMLDYTGVSPNWAFLIPFGIQDNFEEFEERMISIVYGIFIPDQTRIRIEGSKWIPYGEAMSNISETELKILNDALTRRT